MLYELLPLEVIRPITFRAAGAAVLSFVLSLVLFPPFVRFLKRRSIGERIGKGDAPELDRTYQPKADTPTMGGLMMVLSVTVSAALFGNFRTWILPILLAGLAGLTLVGFLDDWTKLRKSPRGLRMSTKLVLQIVVGYGVGIAGYLAMLAQDPDHASRVFLPFDGSIDLGAFYPVFAMLVIVACSNAVNITDGLDGLATGSLTIALFAYAVVCYLAGRSDWSGYLGIAYMRSSAEATVFCTACFGACLGFLWFNAYPAQVFMGDTGALSVGGMLGMVACVAKQEALLVLVGGVFVLEAASSFLQIASFKLFRRRLFPIAPLHHIFHLRGMHEVKITTRLLILQAILSLLALATFKLR